MGSDTPRFVTSPLLPAPHGFFTREGGVTQGHLGALNCGSKFDTAENILENQRRAMDALDLHFDRLCILKQVHSTIVHTITDTLPSRITEGDAMVTRLVATPLGILTADCVPLLFCDAKAGVIGAAHAGWKGALGGIAEATLVAMEALGANRRDIHAAIGACIRQDSYEVGPEYHERFMEDAPGNSRFFKPSPNTGHFYFDLPGYVKMRLAAAGVVHVSDTGIDTCADETRFFSCRRAFLKGEEGFGNGLSVISL